MGQAAKLTATERNRLKKLGFRPVEIWVPDEANPAYRSEAARQVANLVRAESEDDAMDWVDGVSGGDWDRL